MTISLRRLLFMIHWQITLIIVMCLMIGIVGSAKFEQWASFGPLDCNIQSDASKWPTPP